MKSQARSTTVPADDELRPSMAVVDLVARVDGVDPIDLDPLYNAIDPDVLDSIQSGSGFERLEFTYVGRTITVARAGDGLEIALEGADRPAVDVPSVADSEPPA